MRAGLLASLVLALGCGGDQPPADPPGVAVRGTTVFGKKPAAGAVLLFHGTAAGDLPPRAVVAPDGRFELTAPAGTYAVTVEWRTGSDENGEVRKSVVPDKFTRKQSTPLKATVAVGADGTCDLGTLTITK